MTENASATIAAPINAGPVGLFGFAFTTIMLSLCNIGVFEMNALIIALALLFGGVTQFLSGIMEWKGGNSFGMIVFTAFGMFWLVFATAAILPILGLADAASSTAMGWFLVLWAIFAAITALATAGKGIALPVTLWLVFGIFACLAVANFTGIPQITVLGGIVGLAGAAGAFYIGTADLINNAYGCVKLKL